MNIKFALMSHGWIVVVLVHLLSSFCCGGGSRRNGMVDPVVPPFGQQVSGRLQRVQALQLLAHREDPRPDRREMVSTHETSPKRNMRNTITI